MKQRGGAAWYIIPEARKADWNTVLPTLLPIDLAFVTADTRTMEQHFQILEHQDELFGLALSIIASKVGLSTEYTVQDIVDAAAAINAQRGAMMEYIKDVEQLVNFKIETSSAVIYKNQLNLTKLKQIREDSDETLSSLLLFPDRLKNVFVQSLASILIVLKRDDTVLKQSTPDTIDITNSQYIAHVYGSAYVQTGFKPRDGFFIAEMTKDFAKELEEPSGRPPFFKELIQAINTLNKTITVDNAGDKIFQVRESGCLRNIEQSEWGVITAHVFLAYKYGYHKDILQFFRDTCPISKTLDSDKTRRYIPEGTNDETEVRGTTYKKIRSWMGDETLQYILHLCHVIQREEESVLAQVIPTPGTP